MFRSMKTMRNVASDVTVDVVGYQVYAESGVLRA